MSQGSTIEMRELLEGTKDSNFLPDDLLPRGNDFFLPKRQQNKTAFLLRPDLGTGGGGVESRRIRRDPSPPLRGYDEVCCRCCCNCCSENGAGRWGRELDLNGHLDGRWRGCGGCDGVRPGGGPALTTATPDRESTCGGWWTRHHLKFRRSVFKHGAALIHL